MARQSKKAKAQDDVRIVILQRGWVMVGRYSEDGDRCRLDQAAAIRRWGTTRGLPELVSGPTTATVLDHAGVVEFHTLTVVATIRCEARPWAAHLR